MFRNILVCVDGSASAERALSEAIDLADCQNSRLTILTAVCRPPYWANTPMTAAGIEPLCTELAAEAKQTLCDAVARVPDRVPVTTILSEDPIRDAIVEQLKTGRHDLLVMGRGEGRLREALTGPSVCRYAMRHCQIPVLSVRAEPEEEAAAARRREIAASAANTAAPTPLSTSL